jgi:folate-binding protein YgfZ
MAEIPADLAAEYESLRRGRGAYRLPRAVVAVSGPDAPAYLQGQCSQDVEHLAAGQAADALLLAPDGKLVALVRVTRVGPEAFVLDLDAGFADAVVDRLARFKLRTKVEMAVLDWSCVALRGTGWAPGEPDRVVDGVVALAVDWAGWRGIDLLGPDPDRAVPADAHWCGPQAWEACRIESGIPVMGAELDERTIAAEAGLVERSVSFTKGCYTGQELVARLDARGSKVARHLRAVVTTAAPSRDAVLGSTVRAPGAERPVGVCTSAAVSPSLGAVVALAYIHRSVSPPAVVELEGRGGTPTTAEVRQLPLV